MVSIIVPIYNSILYIEECIQSLLHQTHDDLEIILIDDYSTDDVMSVIDPLVAQYEGKKKIRVHRNEKNIGSSATRNLGIEMAKGEYIGFVDCDHFVALDYIEKLLTGFTIKENVGIVSCNSDIVKMYNGNYQYISKHRAKTNVEEKIIPSGAYANEMWSERLSHSIWGKMFRRDIFKQNKLREDRLNAGFSFFVGITKLIEEKNYLFVLLPDTLYHSRDIGNSVEFFRHYEYRYVEQHLRDYQEIIACCGTCRNPLAEEIKSNYLHYLIITEREVLLFGPDKYSIYYIVQKSIKKFSNTLAKKILSRIDYRTFLRIKYLPHIYKYLKSRKESKIAYDSHDAPPHRYIVLGDKALAVDIQKDGSTHLQAIANYMYSGIWYTKSPRIIYAACTDYGLFLSFKNYHIGHNKEIIRFATYIEPFRRLVSVYQDKMKGKEPFLYYTRLGMHSGTTFKEYMFHVRKEFQKTNIEKMDPHIRPQSLFYENNDIDIVVPIEHLKEFLQENNIPTPPEKINASKKPKDYSEFEPYRKEIMQMYCEDYSILEKYPVYNPKKVKSS